MDHVSDMNLPTVPTEDVGGELSRHRLLRGDVASYATFFYVRNTTIYLLSDLVALIRLTQPVNACCAMLPRVCHRTGDHAAEELIQRQPCQSTNFDNFHARGAGLRVAYKSHVSSGSPNLGFTAKHFSHSPHSSHNTHNSLRSWQTPLTSSYKSQLSVVASVVCLCPLPSGDRVTWVSSRRCTTRSPIDLSLVNIYERRGFDVAPGASITCAANAAQWFDEWDVDINDMKPVALVCMPRSAQPLFDFPDESQSILSRCATGTPARS